MRGKQLRVESNKTEIKHMVAIKKAKVVSLKSLIKLTSFWWDRSRKRKKKRVGTHKQY